MYEFVNLTEIDFLTQADCNENSKAVSGLVKSVDKLAQRGLDDAAH